MQSGLLPNSKDPPPQACLPPTLLDIARIGRPSSQESARPRGTGGNRFRFEFQKSVSPKTGEENRFASWIRDVVYPEVPRRIDRAPNSKNRLPRGRPPGSKIDSKRRSGKRRYPWATSITWDNAASISSSISHRFSPAFQSRDASRADA
ncbi:hypothetical protein KM043_004513 [Ampulex compressa]|nr:hypothetical protein KM043_004513 [Ampulex compressa]